MDRSLRPDIPQGRGFGWKQKSKALSLADSIGTRRGRRLIPLFGAFARVLELDAGLARRFAGCDR
jgi:hypothetical protein